MVFALILALAIAIVAVVFALENTMMVTVSFLGNTVEGSLALFILISVGVGTLIGVLIMIPGRIKSSLSNARSRKRIDTLEARLTESEKPAPPESNS